MRPNIGIHVDVLDLDEARLAIRENRTGNRADLIFRLDRQLDVAVVNAGLVALDLGEDDALFLDHDRGRNHVHIRNLAADQAGQQCTGQCLRVHAGSCAVIKDFDFLGGAFLHLTDEGAENIRQTDERLQARRFLSRDRRHIDGVGNRTLDEVIRHLLGNLKGDVFLRFRGRSTEMRRADDVRQAEKRTLGGWLDFEHIETGAGDVAGLDGIGKCRFIHQTATGAVDDTHALLGLGKVLCIEDAACLVGHRHVQGDEIGLRQQLVQLNLGDAHFLRAFRRQEGVISENMHLETECTRADDGADIAGADDAERLAGNFDTHEFRLFPLAGLRGAVGCRKLAGNCEHQRNRVFCRCDGVAERRVHDDDTAARGGRNIDIVDADAGAADNLEVGRSLDQLFGCLGGGADGETIVVADDFGKLVLVLAELRLEIDFDATIAEDLDGGFRQFVGYEYARCHGSRAP